MQYTVNFNSCKMTIFRCKKCDIFSNFLLITYIVVHDRTEAVKMSTHDLGFRAKIRDNMSLNLNGTILTDLN